MNIQHAIVIKEASSSNDLQVLKKLAESNGLVVSTFTKDMLATSDDSKVIEYHATKKISDIEFRGVLVFGNIKQVRKLTENFKLWSGK